MSDPSDVLPGTLAAIVNPAAPVSDLKGVGPALAEKLERLGITTVLDLLFHLPRSFQDRTRIVPLGRLKAGEHRLVEGQIVAAKTLFGKRRSLLVTLSDSTGFLNLRFFHFSRRQAEQLGTGSYVRAFAESRYTNAGLEMVHPEYQRFDAQPDTFTGSFVPVYPMTQGLGQGRLRNLIAQIAHEPWLAANPTYVDALALHRPDGGTTLDALNAIRERLARDELTAHFLIMKRQHRERDHLKTTPLPSTHQLGRRLLDALGFELTRAQRRVITEVLNDLSEERPMFRLLQGDVGSGKTVVAAFAAIRAAEQQAQAAVMAPTEILAEQHYERFSEWLTPLGIEVVLITGSQSAKERKSRIARARDGEAHVIVGTHALFQRSVEFHHLALAIIDEQHRFGVHQRMALRDKGRLPHQLIMTATPIPRTLTMALYADMDVSRIDELPAGRQPIGTSILEHEQRSQIMERMAAACSAGQQAYWVCPLIEPSDDVRGEAAIDTYEQFSLTYPNLRVGLVHGRLPGAEKSAVMRAFGQGELDVLVATTVIEVGVDVPNASLMVIDDADRFGLAQLHQLRGRIGRGSRKSHCILLYRKDVGHNTRKRLDVMRSSNDGFYIAEQDLEIRGAGELLGTRQTGEQSFRVADLTEHMHLIPEVVARGDELMAHDDPEIQVLIDAWAPPLASTIGA